MKKSYFFYRDKRRNNIKEEIKRLAIFGSIYFITYVLFMNMVYTSDHIAEHQMPVILPSLSASISGGRFLNYFVGLFYYLISFLNVTHLENKWVLQILLIVFLALTSNELAKMFRPFFKSNEIVFMLIIAMNFANPYFVESFVYGAPELGFAILLVIIAVKKFIQQRYVWSAILLFCGISLYQGYVALFLIYVFTYVFLDNCEKIEVSILYTYVKVILIAGLAAVTNILIVKLSVKMGVIDQEVKKVSIGSDIFSKISDILVQFKVITVNLLDVFPGKILFWGILGVCLFCFVELLRKEKLKALHFVATVVCLNIFPYAIAFVMDVIWLPPRVSWPIFAAMSMTLILCGSCFRKKWCRDLFNLVVVLEVVFLYYGTETCILDEFVSNALDINNAKVIQGEIEEYEEKSGIEVTDIYVAITNNSNYYHDEAKHFDYGHWMMYSHKIHYPNWSDVEWINYVAGMDYTRHDMTNEEKEKLFKETRYNVFNESEQLFFEGNKLYWLIY